MEPGLSAQPLSGFQGKQPVYVKFDNGVVEIKDENLIEKMLQHPAYTRDGDFIMVEEGERDPFTDRREEMEPTHVMAEIKYGHVEGISSSPSRKTKVNPEIKKLVNDLAMKQIQEMLPGLINEGVKNVLSSLQADARKAAETKEPAAPKASLKSEPSEDEDNGSDEEDEVVEEKVKTPSKASKASK